MSFTPCLTSPAPASETAKTPPCTISTTRRGGRQSGMPTVRSTRKEAPTRFMLFKRLPRAWCSFRASCGGAALRRVVPGTKKLKSNDVFFVCSPPLHIFPSWTKCENPTCRERTEPLLHPGEPRACRGSPGYRRCHRDHREVRGVRRCRQRPPPRGTSLFALNRTNHIFSFRLQNLFEPSDATQFSYRSKRLPPTLYRCGTIRRSPGYY